MNPGTSEEKPDEGVTHQAERAEESAPTPESEPVQTPAPNTGAITDHIKSVQHSMLTNLEANDKAHRERLDFLERKIDDGFGHLKEVFDNSHREAVRGIALNASSEIAPLLNEARELIAELRKIAVSVTASRNAGQ